MKTLNSTLPPLLLLSILSACSGGKNPGPNPFATKKMKLETYANCSELEQDLKARHDYYTKYKEWLYSRYNDSMVDLAPGSGAAAAGEDSGNFQVAGVSESDIVKVTEKQIYFARDERVEVIDRSTWQVVGSLSLPELSEITLYVAGDALFVLGSTRLTTQMKKYSFRDGALPEEVQNLEWTGKLNQSRLKDGKLLVVMKDWGYDGYGYYVGNTQTPDLTTKAGRYRGTRCSRVYKPFTGDLSFIQQKFVLIDVQDSAHEPEPTSLFMAEDDMYVTSENIYLFASFQNTVNASGDWDAWDFTGVGRLSWPEDAKQTLVEGGAGVFNGRIYDRYAAHEKEGVLLVASTQSERGNYLFALEEKGNRIEPVAKVGPFAPGESIYSVRYMNDRAYVVTFLQVDPLFSFDISNARAPQMTGALKVPGVSTYLHSFSEAELVGVGMKQVGWGGSQLQLSLFDVSGGDAVQSDVKVMGKPGSSSEALSNPLAFYADTDNKLFAMPLRLVNSSHETYFKGARIFRIDGTEFKIVGSISHEDLETCSEGDGSVRRIMKVDNKWFTVGNAGFKLSDTDGAISTLNQGSFLQAPCEDEDEWE